MKLSRSRGVVRWGGIAGLVIAVGGCGGGGARPGQGDAASGDGSPGAGDGGTPSTCPPDPAPAGAAMGEDAGIPGCTLWGVVTLPERTDHSGTRVTVGPPELGLQGQTDAMGQYAVGNVPPGVFDIHYRNGAFGEFIAGAACNWGSAPRASIGEMPPIELYRGKRVTQSNVPLGLTSTSPPARVVEEAAAPGATVSMVVDAACGPARALACSAPEDPSSLGSSLVTCFGNSRQVWDVPFGAGAPEKIVESSSVVFASSRGRHVAYVDDANAVFLVDVKARQTRSLMVKRATWATLHFTPDETRVFFFDERNRLLMFSTDAASGADSTVVATVPAPMGPLALTTWPQVAVSPDSQWIAFFPPECFLPCELRLATAAGTVRSLGMGVKTSDPRFSADSKVLVATRYGANGGELASFPVEGGTSTAFSPIAAGSIWSITDNGRVLYEASGQKWMLAGIGGGAATATIDATRLNAVSPDGRWAFFTMALGEPGFRMAALKMVNLDDLSEGIVADDADSLSPVLFSPDFALAAFRTGEGGAGDIRTVLLDARATVTVVDSLTEAPASLAFSPDGRWLSYGDAIRVKMAPATGGPLTILSTRLRGHRITWLGSLGVVAQTIDDDLHESNFENGLYFLTPP